MKKMDNLITRTKSFYGQNIWRGRAILVLIIFLLVIGLFRISLSPVIAYSAKTWLKNQGIDTTIEDISINVFDSSFTLINAVGKNQDGELFHVDEVTIDWSWRPLAQKTVVIHSVVLSNLKADIQHYSDSIVVAGILIPLTDSNATQQQEETEEVVPVEWAAELNEVTFNNIETCFEQYSTQHDEPNSKKLLDYCVMLADMSWSGSVGYAVNKALIDKDPVPVSSEGDFVLSKFRVTDRIQSKSMLYIDKTQLKNVRLNGLNDISIDSININQLSALQREDTRHKDIVRMEDLLLKDFSFKDLSSLSLADISVDSPGLYLVKHKDKWEYESWLPASSSNTNETSKPSDATQSSAKAETGSFKLALGDIKISESDFCLNETDIEQYYCLNLANLDWNGAVATDASDSEKLTAQGSLTLDKLLVRNRTIERDLTRFDKLVVDDIDARDINNATIKNISLIKLAALQRSDKDNDYTLNLDSIDVKTTAFENGRNLHIKSIVLAELGAHASINKDGSFEHDKWLPKDSTAKNDKEAASKDKDDDVKEGHELNFRLDNFELTTKRPLLFTDSVYTPPLEAGLKTLSLSVQKLDSNKPEQESPFELSTKTTRHGTADVKGVIMPFKEKLSFDATGKVSGIDLRAFSNAAKKEIGHIIKSGQLDADLKLLSVNGELDSKIGLKLHHFNLKAVSKEDAKALDDMFGMPINQSLILLKDKSDTISLNIPITGDVNNPSFNPMDAIIKATAKATTVTLVTFYTPYGLAYAGGNLLFNMATALNFEPIPYKPGSSEMTSAGQEQLDKLATLLKEKPHLHLTMCGMTNLTDIHELYSRTKDLKEGEELKLKPKQIEKLETIAQERQIKAKDYLVNTHAIDHSQLVLCAPETHMDAKSTSGVEITI